MDLLEKRTKGQEKPHLIELTGAGLDIGWTIRKAFSLNVEARQDYYILYYKEYAPLGAKALILVNTVK